MVYKGWTISYNPAWPVTGIWRAERHGVGMCNGTKESLLRMVDVKVLEQRQAEDLRRQA